MSRRRPQTTRKPEAAATAPGTLFVVATPIGNLEDITLRALRILKEAALIAAEDTRHTRKLLAHFGITTPLVSYYREKEIERGREIVLKLLAGKDVALVSDAGTPGISDPGGILVELARKAQVPVVPIPGPSSLTTALSVAGNAFFPFLFLGFPPSRAGQRRKFLAAVAHQPCALVFFESPQRLRACLNDCQEIFGDRRALVARELTKMHEEIRMEKLSRLTAEQWGTVKGEVVVAVEGPPGKPKADKEDVHALLALYREEEKEISLREAVQRAARELQLPRSEVYREALRLWKR